MQKICKVPGFLAKAADAVLPGQGGNVHQNAALSHNHFPFHLFIGIVIGNVFNHVSKNGGGCYSTRKSTQLIGARVTVASAHCTLP